MDTKSDFIVKIVKDLLANNFSVFLHRTDNIDGYGGWLRADEEEKSLTVALDHAMGFEILLHEYCHFKQFKENIELWNKSLELYDLLFDWCLNPKKRVSKQRLEESMRSIIEIEHDCEKRVLKLLLLNPIEGVSIKQYTKAANAYLWSYQIMRKIRKKSKSPIYTDQVISNMSCELNDLEFYYDINNLTEEMEDSLLIEFNR